MYHATKKPYRAIVFACLALSALLTTSFGARAAIINPLVGLDIGGTVYDVTFHDSPLFSFNELWDQNDNGIFGDDSSVFSTAPTFWLNRVGAEAARDAIISALGSIDLTSPGTDSFVIPIGGQSSFTSTIVAGAEVILGALDNEPTPDNDNPVSGGALLDDSPRFNFPIATFRQVSTQGVPAPFTPALLVPGLIALAALRKRKATQVA